MFAPSLSFFCGFSECAWLCVACIAGMLDYSVNRGCLPVLKAGMQEIFLGGMSGKDGLYDS